MWESLITMTDAGSVAITDGNLRMMVSNGWGDGHCVVKVAHNGESLDELPYEMDFVDSFDVKEHARILSYDCDGIDDEGICDLEPGRWFIYRVAGRVYDEGKREFVTNPNMPEYGYVALQRYE